MSKRPSTSLQGTLQSEARILSNPTTLLLLHVPHLSPGPQESLRPEFAFCPPTLYMPPSCSQSELLEVKADGAFLEPNLYPLGGWELPRKGLSSESFVLPACSAELSFPYQVPFLVPHFCPHSMPLTKCAPLGSAPLCTLYPRVILDVPSDMPGICPPRQGQGASGSQWFWTRRLVSHPGFGSCTAVKYVLSLNFLL